MRNFLNIFKLLELRWRKLSRRRDFFGEILRYSKSECEKIKRSCL